MPKSAPNGTFQPRRHHLSPTPAAPACGSPRAQSNDGVSGLATGLPAAAQASKPPAMDTTLR